MKKASHIEQSFKEKKASCREGRENLPLIKDLRKRGGPGLSSPSRERGKEPDSHYVLQRGKEVYPTIKRKKCGKVPSGWISLNLTTGAGGEACCLRGNTPM